MSAQLYTLAFVTVAGKLLTEHTEAQVNRSTNSQQVATVAKGYAGESPGAPMVEIDVTNAVPAADFEMDPGPYMANLDVVEIGVLVAGKQLIASGFIISDSFSSGVNTESKLSFKFRGTFPQYE